MKQRRFTQEVRLASSGKQALEWTIGGFYTHEKNRLGPGPVRDRRPSPATPISSFDGLILVDLPSRYSEYAGFANATWHMAPKFDLTAGGRWSHNKQSEEQNTIGLLARRCIVLRRAIRRTASFTYSVAPTFKPNDNTRIYARVAKGYRPGGPNALSPLRTGRCSASSSARTRRPTTKSD